MALDLVEAVGAKIAAGEGDGLTVEGTLTGADLAGTKSVALHTCLYFTTLAACALVPSTLGRLLACLHFGAVAAAQCACCTHTRTLELLYPCLTLELPAARGGFGPLLRRFLVRPLALNL